MKLARHEAQLEKFQEGEVKGKGNLLAVAKLPAEAWWGKTLAARGAERRKTRGWGG